jgi:hypothetical protein
MRRQMTRPTRNSTALLLGALGWWFPFGCASTNVPAMRGHRLELELLAPGKVRMEKQLYSTPELLAELRLRVAAANGDPEAMPRVVLIGTDGVYMSPWPAQLLQVIAAQTGVRSIELEWQ